MKIITISREFGSGGRELGKRMADILGYDYYDREIIAKIAEREGLSNGFVNNVINNHEWRNVPVTFRNSFTCAAYQSARVSLIEAEKRVIDGIGESGHDAIIVGRNSDVYLKKYNPFNIFVCADMSARVKRCREYGDEARAMSEREIEKQILRIDKNRAAVHDLASDHPWGERNAYNLVVNTADWEIKKLAPVVAEFAKKWFGNIQEGSGE